MPNKITKICLFLVIGSLFFAGPVTGAAAISTIRPGNTVFIGEQGLDITPAMEGDTQIGWWASGAPIIGSSPTSGLVPVSNPTSFSVSQNIFGTRTGVWYHLDPSGKAKGSAFTVADPQLDIRVEDTTVNVDVTDKWVSTEDELRFRIDTNLVSITQRTGVVSTPITIKVQSPSGGIYSSLISNKGATTPIVDFPVTTSPQYTNPIWGTINRDTYPPGTYTIWAECNVNSQSPSVPLYTSRKVSVLNQDQNPLIVNKGYVTNPTTQLALVPTTKITSIATPVLTTLETPLPTTAVPTVLPMTTAVTVMPITSPPSPTQTKSPGFEASIVVVAMIFGLVLIFKK